MTFAIFQSNAIKSLIAIGLLALVFLFVKQLHRIEVNSRDVLLSAGAGASLVYVLMRILPKLAEKQETLTASADFGLRGFLEHHAYLVAMLGLVIHFGISYFAAHRLRRGSSSSPRQHGAALLASVFAAGAYAVLIAYLIVNYLNFGLVSLALITFAMGIVLLVSGHGLRQEYPDAYDSWIRWFLSISLLTGWALGVFVEISPNVVALWYAFLVGIILSMTFREKISIERVGSFWPFLAGVALFTVLLLILEQMPQMAL